MYMIQYNKYHGIVKNMENVLVWVIVAVQSRVDRNKRSHRSLEKISWHVEDEHKISM